MSAAPSKPENGSRTHRRLGFRFGLRTILILLLVAGLLANWQRRADWQSALVDRIQAAGGSVELYHEVEHDGFWGDVSWPSRHYWQNVHQITFGGDRPSLQGTTAKHQFDDIELLGEIGKLTHVENVSFLGYGSELLGKLVRGKSLGTGQLKILGMHLTDTSDLSLLGHFSELAYLRLEGSESNDFAVLKNLKNLQRLEVFNSNLEDLTPLRSLLELKNIRIVCSKVSDINPLENLQKLDEVAIVSSNLCDITPIGHLKKLRSVNFDLNQITDISVASKLPGLVHLRLDGNPVSDLSPLMNHPTLVNLYVSQTEVIDLGPLATINTLVGISIKKTDVQSLTPLLSLPELQWLGYTHGSISDQQLEQVKKRFPNCILSGLL